MTGTTNTPAGWYPQADGQQRYWNGESWTEHVAPGVLTQPVSGPSSKPTQLAAPRSRFGKAAAFGWGGLALTALIGALSSGFSGAAILAGLFALVLGLIALARGRVGWARLRNRAAGGVVIGVALALLTIGAVAAPPAAATSYDNCTDMHADYKGGVALPGAVDHRSSGGHANYPPVYSRSLYEANSGSDRDGDGIACEA